MTGRRRRAATTGIATGISPHVRRPWAFTKGILAGAVLVIPAIAATVWVLGRLGFGDPELRMLKAIRATALFGGVAAIFTAGGVGRLAAQAAAEEGASRRRPLLVAGRAFAVAGIGLTIIAAIPHGHLPASWPGFLVIALAGALTGALCGTVIGAVCGGAAQLGLTDVMALARWPTDALRALLEPEDLEAAARGAPRRRRRITIPFLFPAQARAEAAAAKSGPTASTPVSVPAAPPPAAMKPDDAAPAPAPAPTSTPAPPAPADPAGRSDPGDR